MTHFILLTANNGKLFCIRVDQISYVCSPGIYGVESRVRLNSGDDFYARENVKEVYDKIREVNRCG